MKNIKIGDVMVGRITGAKPYGIFVKLPNGKSGLLHRSNCDSYKYHYMLGSYNDDYNDCINNAICCKIRDISNGRISLEQGDWKELSNISIDRNINNINIPTHANLLHCSVYVDDKNQYYTFKNGILYSKDEKTIIKIFSSLEYIKINNVENILPGAVPHNVKSLDLSESEIKSIDSWTFSNLGIETLVLPSSCTVRKNAFYQCTNLKTIIFNDDDTIEYGAFDDCDALEEIKNLNYNYDFLRYMGVSSSVLGKKLLNKEQEILTNNSKFSLDDIKNIIKEKKNENVYIKWYSSDFDHYIESRICRIVDNETKISVETNGYIYYIYPYQIVEILSTYTNTTPFPEDWFGGESYWD